MTLALRPLETIVRDPQLPFAAITNPEQLLPEARALMSAEQPAQAQQELFDIEQRILGAVPTSRHETANGTGRRLWLAILSAIDRKIGTNFATAQRARYSAPDPRAVEKQAEAGYHEVREFYGLLCTLATDYTRAQLTVGDFIIQRQQEKQKIQLYLQRTTELIRQDDADIQEAQSYVTSPEHEQHVSLFGTAVTDAVLKEIAQQRSSLRQLLATHEYLLHYLDHRLPARIEEAQATLALSREAQKDMTTIMLDIRETLQAYEGLTSPQLRLARIQRVFQGAAIARERLAEHQEASLEVLRTETYQLRAGERVRLALEGRDE